MARADSEPRETLRTDSTWRPSEAEEVGRFSLGRRAFNADEADCCACEGTCRDLLQGPDLPICRAFPLGEDARG